MKSWFQFMVEKGKNCFVGNILCVIPLFGLFACIPQQTPQLDSLQEQISALRTDIEEVQESRRDIRRLGADISQLSSKLDENTLNPTRRVEETSRLLLQNIVDSRIQMKELVDEISAIKENFNEHSQVIRDISIQTKTLESNLIKQILKLQAKIEKSIPEKLYSAAQDFFMNKHYHEAYKTFNAFIKQYPQHSLKENAWLFKGETLYRMGEFAKAVAECDLFASNNSKSSLISAILYLKAESLSSLERKPEAKEIFQHLITDYPLSEEAIRAKPRLDLLP